jgi:hypothetical protein
MAFNDILLTSLNTRIECDGIVTLVLTVLNLVLLIFVLAQVQPRAAQDVTPVLRGRTLELVDDR